LQQYLQTSVLSAPALYTSQRLRVIMATVPSGKAMSSVIGGLGIDGVLLVLGASLEPITVPPVAMIGRRLSIKGS
jgi:D-arabinose 1-dehydrogenase-like Zn-dependent alcohol dehydrogenase